MRWYETILSFTCARPQHQRKGNTHEPTIYICDHLCPECVYGALEHNVFWHEHSCFVAFLVAFSVSLFVLIMWATAWVFTAFSLCLLVVWVHTVLITRCVLAVFTTVFLIVYDWVLVVLGDRLCSLCVYFPLCSRCVYIWSNGCRCLPCVQQLCTDQNALTLCSVSSMAMIGPIRYRPESVGYMPMFISYHKARGTSSNTIWR